MMAATQQSNPVIGPYPKEPALVCHEYDPRAPDVAQRVAGMITAYLPDATVEHVGSTAVPGCAGKGIIDLLVLYPAGRLEAARQALAALGFQRQTMGHIWPEDRPMRVGTLEHDGARFRIHAHVVAATSPEVATFRDFRDRLRADPELVAAYVERKRRILGQGVSKAEEYTRLKGEFFESLHRG